MSETDPTIFDLLATVRTTARRQGYAIAVHGSLARDIDLVAVPWTPDAEQCGAYKLVEKLLEATGGFLTPGETWPRLKPHGRMCWAIHLIGTGTYLDLSVLQCDGETGQAPPTDRDTP